MDGGTHPLAIILRCDLLDRATTWSGAALLQVGAKMKKFMAIYMASGADFERMMKNSTAEQRNKGMAAWMKWMNENKASILEGGAPLGKTKRADATGVSDTKNNIGGYSIVQAETHDERESSARQGITSDSSDSRTSRIGSHTRQQRMRVLFDHPVGARQYCVGHSDAKCFCR